MPPLLQPIAHALLQASEELNAAMANFPNDLLWQRPAEVASVGFHLQHLTGVLDRLMTYARSESLNDTQLTALQAEGKPIDIAVPELVSQFNIQVDQTISQLRTTPKASLTQYRRVGRAGLPSTVIGLLVHSAEHTTRHVGQLIVTARIVQAGSKSGD